MADLESEIASLRRERDELREERDALKAVYSEKAMKLRTRFGLTRTEARIVAMLLRCGVQSRDRLTMFACNDDTADATLNVHICRIRRKIAPLRIRTMAGDGYYIGVADVETLRSAL